MYKTLRFLLSSQPGIKEDSYICGCFMNGILIGAKKKSFRLNTLSGQLADFTPPELNNETIAFNNRYLQTSHTHTKTYTSIRCYTHILQLLSDAFKYFLGAALFKVSVLQ